VAASGAHRGGLIVPGIEIMKRSLLKDTSDIRFNRIADSQPIALLARGTADAVNSGAVYLASAMIDRVMSDIVAECGENIEFLITGGDAGRILPLLGRQPNHDPDLVLKGVAILARETPCAT
jgi:type III pantothenate kinase